MQTSQGRWEDKADHQELEWRTLPKGTQVVLNPDCRITTLGDTISFPTIKPLRQHWCSWVEYECKLGKCGHSLICTTLLLSLKLYNIQDLPIVIDKSLKKVVDYLAM